MARNVIAFINQPTPQYVSVGNLTFPAPPILPGMYQVPSRAIPFPNRMFNKDGNIPFMNVMSIFDYERSGKVQI